MARKLSFESRIAISHGRTSRAVKAFETAIQELDEAARCQDEVANEIDDEIARLKVLRNRADQAVRDNTDIADKIRGLIS